MKQYSIAGLVIVSVFGLGFYYYHFGITTEVVYLPTEAYVEGATPPLTQHWEMY